MTRGTNHAPDESHIITSGRLPSSVANRRRSAQAILDQKMHVVWYAPPSPPYEISLAIEPGAEIPSILREPVQTIVDQWNPAEEHFPEGVSLIAADIVVRTFAYLGGRADDWRVGLSLEGLHGRDSLEWARVAYSLSAREIEILSCLLKGLPNQQIAAMLSIAESTAADHVRRLLEKTEANNRAELVARVLGWQTQ